MIKPEGKQGQTCRYRLAENALAALKPLEGLTTPAQLVEALAKCGDPAGPTAHAVGENQENPDERMRACG
jgi:hypothetical protein